MQKPNETEERKEGKTGDGDTEGMETGDGEEEGRRKGEQEKDKTGEKGRQWSSSTSHLKPPGGQTAHLEWRSVTPPALSLSLCLTFLITTPPSSTAIHDNQKTSPASPSELSEASLTM